MNEYFRTVKVLNLIHTQEKPVECYFILNIKFHLKLQQFNMHLPQLIMMDGFNQMIQLYLRKIAGAQCLHEGAMTFRSRHFLRFGYVTLFWILCYILFIIIWRVYA